MAPVKVLVGRLVFFLMKILDYLLSFTGIKLVSVNLQSVLRGLSPEELEESRDPTIAGPLGLFVDCVEKARPEHLDVVGRILFKETLRDILRKRVGIKKTLAEHPDILHVSEPFRHLTKKTQSGLKSVHILKRYDDFVMTARHGNIFCVTGPLWGKSPGGRWIPPQRVSNAELWCILCCILNKRLNKQWSCQ